MREVILVIHVLIAAVMVVVILLQRSEGGALGIGGGGGGMMSARGLGNVLTRMTAFLAAMFMLTSIFLTVLATGGSGGSILNDAPPSLGDLELPPLEPVPEIPDTDE